MTPVYGTTGSALPALRFEAEPQARPEAHGKPVVATEPAPARPRKTPVYQPSLFGTRELPRVVPFESIAPESVQPPVRKPGPPRARHRKIIPGQQSLEFAARPSEGVIYCDAPVAIPAHRAMAAALDASLILIATALFGLVFYLAGGSFILDSKSAPVVAVIVGMIALFYKLLWCLGNGDSAGMSWTRLRLVNFDGRVPDRRHRMYRQASGVLSLLAAGLGMLWSLVDEETLTWHDHISKTFPTPY